MVAYRVDNQDKGHIRLIGREETLLGQIQQGQIDLRRLSIRGEHTDLSVHNLIQNAP